MRTPEGLIACVLFLFSAPTAATWQQAQLRALSMSGVCSQGRWRRFFPNSTGKVNHISTCTYIPEGGEQDL
jgi:hypothetical protein